MASPVLVFPTDRSFPRRSRLYAGTSALALDTGVQDNGVQDNDIQDPDMHVAAARREQGADDAHAAAAAEITGGHSLQLVYSRPRAQKNDLPGSRTQAQHINAQVDRELAGRVEREAAERRSAYCPPSRGQRRALASRLPVQATAVGLRHRLLDALLFFARPAWPAAASPRTRKVV